MYWTLLWDCTGILGCEVVPNICALITGTNSIDSHSCEKYWVTCDILTDLHSMFTVQGCSTFGHTGTSLYHTYYICPTQTAHIVHTLYVPLHSNTQSTNMQVFTWLCIDNTPVSMNVLKMKAVENTYKHKPQLDMDITHIIHILYLSHTN